ncbi:acyltransferase family protein [Stenotrophomonas sp. 2MCAF14_2]|uniref:acyltransferase family protein n=1 Tax=Stenotrophomonas sp. 2MCAF14_2 TaxID=3232983 RepID=UPI003F991E21
MGLKYRADIDGLRAIAVLGVLLYHLDPRLVPGGYVGVDVFFVISGFLISRIIYGEMEAGSFSIARFYVRRARRILPALLSVVLATSVVAMLVLYPSERVQYAQSAIASILFSANFYFYATLNYFSPAADEIPLLHLWSLGIEEQFYILFPLLALLLTRIGRKLFTGLLGVLFLASLLTCAWALAVNPSGAFYLLPFRAFELLTGALIALVPVAWTPARRLAGFLSWVGLAAIVTAMYGFDKGTHFPGFAALLPCAGAAMLIMAHGHGQVGRLLSSRGMVWVGKRSYSLYLVHWPVIVFAHRFWPDSVSMAWVPVLAAVSLLLAHLNFELVEQKLRNAKPSWRNGKVLATSALSMLVVVSAGMVVVKEKGFPGSQDAHVAQVLASLDYDPSVDYRSRTCFLDPDQSPDQADVSGCIPGKGQRRAMLWGDSHAIHFLKGFQPAFAAKGYEIGALTASACPPLVGVEIGERPHCKAFNDFALQRLVDEKPDVVILSALWYADPAWMSALDKSIAALRAADIRVVVLGISPMFKQRVPLVVADKMRAGADPRYSSTDLDPNWISGPEAMMKAHFKGRTDATFISVMDRACVQGRCPLLDEHDHPLYYDIAHLTPEGSVQYAALLVPVILD